MLFKAVVILLGITLTKADNDKMMSFNHKQKLSDNFEMEWTIGDKNITWKLKAKTTGWVGIGITPTSKPRKMRGADIVIAGVNSQNTGYIMDTMAKRNGAPTVDDSENVQLLSAEQENGFTIVEFTRPLSAANSNDRPITPGRVGIIWGFGMTDIIGLPRGSNYHGKKNRGKTSLVFMRPTPKPKEIVSTPVTHTLPNSVYLDDDETVMLKWGAKDKSVEFELSAPTTGWVGVGFSPGRNMKNADIIIAGVDMSGNAYVYDCFATQNGRPSIDIQQNVELIDSSFEEGGRTTVKFKRKFETGDVEDREIDDDEINIIYAYGSRDIVGNVINPYHFKHRGSKRLILVEDDDDDDDDEDDDEDDHDSVTGVSEDDMDPTDGGDAEEDSDHDHETDHGCSPDLQNEEIFADGKITLRWCSDDESVNFELSASTTGWVGVGFSPGSNMKDADIIIAGVDMNGNAYVHDCFAKRNGQPAVDIQQNVELKGMSLEKDGKTTVRFKRMLVTGDIEDREITEGEMNVIFAYGSSDIVGGVISPYHFSNRGSKRVAIIEDDDDEEEDHDPDGDDTEEDHKDEDHDRDCFQDLHNKETLANGRMTLRWCSDDKNIFFEVTAETLGWFGVGFSPIHGMKNADIIMCGVKDGVAYAYDAFAFDNVLPTVDAIQNVEVLSGEESNSQTTVRFKRQLMSSEPFDRNIKGEDNFLIWAIGAHDLVDGPHFVNYHFQNRGGQKLQLIDDKDENEGDDSEPEGNGEENEGDEPEVREEGFLTGESYLNDAKTVLLKWKHDRRDIEFELSAPTTGWIAMGFSPTGTMKNADMIMCGVSASGAYILDVHAKKNGVPIVDDKQNIEIVSSDEKDGMTTVRFRGPIVTDDQSQDNIIMDGEIGIIWAYGAMDLDGNPIGNDYHFKNRGSRMLEIIPSISRNFASGKIVLNQNGVILQWSRVVDTIYFQLSAPSSGWVGLGFCPGKNMKNCDIIMSGVKDGAPYIFDCFAPRNTAPKVDAIQDVTIMAAQEAGNKTIVLFQRRVEGNENRRDRDILPGETNVIWAYGMKDVDKRPKKDIYHMSNRGWMKVALIPDTSGMAMM